MLLLNADCQAWNTIIAPLLYREILTANVDKLFWLSDRSRASPLIASKGANLGLIRTLYLEYPYPSKRSCTCSSPPGPECGGWVFPSVEALQHPLIT